MDISNASHAVLQNATSPAVEAVGTALIVSLIGPVVRKWFEAKIATRRAMTDKMDKIEEERTREKESASELFKEMEFRRAIAIQDQRDIDYTRLVQRVVDLEQKNREQEYKIRELQSEIDRLSKFEIK